MSQIREYGKDNSPGIRVREVSSSNSIPDPIYGTSVAIGNTRRGPMGVLVPVRSSRTYGETFGDPSDRTWHLFENSAHLLPDFVDDYFTNSAGAGVLFVGRLPFKNARCSEIILKNRLGSPALKITAANEGRWGGAYNVLPPGPVVVATPRTFTRVSPGVKANEFAGAEAEFSDVAGRLFRIAANTEAHPVSGEVVYTVGAQYNLLFDGVTGPVTITGTASYVTLINLTGTVAFPLFKPVTGTAAVNSTVITGVGTAFTTELKIGSNVYKDGEARVITSITSATTATISEAFSTDGTGLTLQIDNLTVTGTGTTFTNLAVGDRLYVTVDQEQEWRTVAAIVSATSLTLSSGFSNALSAATAVQIDNLVVTGTGTAFTTEFSLGSFIVDPNRSGAMVKVTAIDSATSLKVEKPFSRNFSAAQLTKQQQLASVTLAASANTGLSVRVVQGERKPETHFGLEIFFNGSKVLTIADASLDPADPDFVEAAVDQQNVAHSTGVTTYNSWIKATNLWTSDYTTDPAFDVRPCNGAGTILHLTASRLYTVANLDYTSSVGELLYPNPYDYPRSYFRVQNAVAPKTLTGTLSSTGVNVTGTSSLFRTELKPGDYLYDPASKTVRKVRVVQGDTTCVLETAFAENLDALTKGQRSGYLQTAEAYDLTLNTEVGKRFFAVYPEILTRGYDGNTANLSPSLFSHFLDPDTNLIEKAVINQNLGFLRVFCPGISDISIQKMGSLLAEQKAFEFRCEAPSYITNSAVAESFVNKQLGRSDFITLSFPSYGYKANPLGNGYRFVSLSGYIAGGESRRARANQGYHFVYAGVDAVLPGIVKLPVALDPSDEAILNNTGIQPIIMLDGNAVVFGARSPSISQTYKFTHIRRIQSHYIRVLIEARNLLSLLFLPNQPGTLDLIVLMLEQFARNEYAKKVLTNFLGFREAVDISGSFDAQNSNSEQAVQNSVVTIVNGELYVQFFYVPTGILEVLSISVGPQVLVDRYGTNG